MKDKINVPSTGKSRSLIDYAKLSSCGFAMGAADVVPGVSGGTMAFILGIYEELIDSIRAMASPHVLKLILGLKIKEALSVTPWKFLVAVGAGILLAILTLAKFLKHMLENHPVLLWAFFFGLVLASIITVFKRVNDWGFSRVCAVLGGTVAAYVIVGLVPVQTPETAWFLFLCGFIAICAMILPGISGSFILLILGKYQFVITAVSNISDTIKLGLSGKFNQIVPEVLFTNMMTLLLVASGCLIGIASFAQILGWLFKHFHDLTVAILIGLMIGSLRKIWPWKQTIREIIDRHGHPKPIEQINILPSGDIAFPVVLAIAGFVVVLILDYFGNSRPANSRS